MGSVFSAVEWFLSRLGFAGLLIAPAAWIVFAVACVRWKNSFTATQRRRRRVVRTVSLILAVIFTICVMILCIGLMEGPAAPLPQTTSLPS